jgi:hypothetical protein
MTPGTWNRLVMVVNTDSTTATVVAYVNGDRAYSFDISNADALNRLRFLATNPIYFSSDDSGENRQMDLATVGVWGRALSAQEVAALGAVGDNGILASAYLNSVSSAIEYSAAATTVQTPAPVINLSAPAQVTVHAGGTLNFSPLDGSVQVLAGLPDLRSLVTDKGWTFNRQGTAPELWTTDLQIGTSTNRADAFTATATAWLDVKTTGSYIFWVAADDAVTLRIRDEAGGVIAVARDNSAGGWGAFEATKGGNADYVLNTGATFLEAGKRYKIEAVLTEGSGSDYFKIGYTTTTTPAGKYVANVVGSSENYPPLSVNTNLEMVTNAFDGTTAKYLNADSFGNTANSLVSRDSGLMFRLSSASALTRIAFQSAGDTPAWNPTRFTLYGSNSPLTWGDGQWALVGEGSTGLTGSSGNNVWGADFNLASGTAYAFYKLVLNQTAGVAGSNYLMQIAEVRLSDAAGQIAALPASASTSPTIVSNNGTPFALTPDFAGTDFTLTFNVGTGGLIDVGSAGNVDRLAGLGLVVSGDRTASAGRLAAAAGIRGPRWHTRTRTCEIARALPTLRLWELLRALAICAFDSTFKIKLKRIEN